MKVKEEQRDRIEHLDMLVSPLTLQGQEGKTLLKDAKNALLDAGVPSRLKPDRYVPWYYGEASYTSQEEIPWHVEAKRALTPAEGVAWLASERDGLAQQQGAGAAQPSALWTPHMEQDKKKSAHQIFRPSVKKHSMK